MLFIEGKLIRCLVIRVLNILKNQKLILKSRSSLSLSIIAYKQLFTHAKPYVYKQCMYIQVKTCLYITKINKALHVVICPCSIYIIVHNNSTKWNIDCGTSMNSIKLNVVENFGEKCFYVIVFNKAVINDHTFSIINFQLLVAC